MIVMIPVLAVFFGQISGLFLVNQQFIIVAAMVLIIVDVFLEIFSVRVFQREVILTRWK
jgi:ABC-2 type transport system permease protein